MSIDKKYKVLFIIHEMSMGGATRVMSNLVNGLDRELFNVHLAVFTNKGILLDEIKNDVCIHNLNASRVALGTHKLLWLILKEKPHIVFTGITHVNLLVAMLIPFLKIFLNETKFVTREVNNPSIRAKYLKKSKKMDFVYKRFISKFDTIIAQSNFMKNDIVRSYDIDSTKVKVINNPLDQKAINKKLEEKKSQNPFQKDKVNILATGMLRKQKGFERLIDLLSLLDDRYHLHIVGEGSERKTLESKIRRLKIEQKVTLWGLQKNPYYYMKNADIVVLSSLYEGFPNVILEANACGKFVVAFSCPGVGKEIIKHELNGVLVEDNNINQLAKAIKKYAKKEHDQEKIIQTVHRFTVSSIVEAYKKTFITELSGRALSGQK